MNLQAQRDLFASSVANIIKYYQAYSPLVSIISWCSRSNTFRCVVKKGTIGHSSEKSG